MKCAITGVNGYLGGRLKKYFEAQGCEILSLSHTGSSSVSGKSASFDLRQGVDGDVFKGTDVLVHCAYDFSLARWEDIFKINVQGSIRLLKTAKSAGVKKILYVSTMSSFQDCKSLYGKAKLLIEDEARKVGAFILRPGLIYDMNASGMVGALQGAVRKLPIVPLIGKGDQILYLVHVDDLCRFFFTIATELVSAPEIPVTVAHENGFSFKEILQIIARANNRSVRFLPVPSMCIFGMLKIAESLGLKMRLSSDSVTGLVHYDRDPSFMETRRLDFHPRLFSEELFQQGC